MAAFVGGDESAFEELVARHGAAIKGFAARVTGDWPSAEDVFVETFTRLAEMAPRWRPTGSVRSLLFTIAYRRCLDRRRGRRRRLRALDGLTHEPRAAGAPDPEDAVHAARRAAELEDAIAALPADHRAAVLLTYRTGLSSREVGAVLGWTDQQVRSRLAYARRLLRQRLAPRSGEGE